MTASSTLTFCMSQFDELAERYLEDGTAVLRAERLADIDGARRVLLSDAFKKVRKDFAPDPAPQRTLLGIEQERAR